MKTQSFLTGYAPEIYNEREDEKADDRDDLETGKDELCFAIHLDRKDIQGKDDNNEYGDPNCNLALC